MSPASRRDRSLWLAAAAALLLGAPLAAMAYRYGAPRLTSLFKETPVQPFALMTTEGQKPVSPDLKAPYAAQQPMKAPEPAPAVAVAPAPPPEQKPAAAQAAPPQAPPQPPPAPPLEVAELAPPGKSPIPHLQPGALRQMDQNAQNFLMNGLVPANAAAQGQSQAAAQNFGSIRSFSYSQVVAATANVAPVAPSAPQVKPVAAPAGPAVRKLDLNAAPVPNKPAIEESAKP